MGRPGLALHRAVLWCRACPELVEGWHKVVVCFSASLRETIGCPVVCSQLFRVPRSEFRARHFPLLLFRQHPHTLPAMRAANRLAVALAPTIPYIAVAVGMYVFNSGLAAMFAYHAGICAALLCTGSARDWRRKLVAGCHMRTAAMLVPLFACAGPIIFLLWPYVSLKGTHLSSSLAVFGLQGRSWIVFLVYYPLVNPWLEELFWRGLLARGTHYGRISDLLYAGYHVLALASFTTVPWLLFCFAVLAVAGATWRILAARNGGLALPALTHLVADIAVIVAACQVAGK